MNRNSGAGLGRAEGAGDGARGDAIAGSALLGMTDAKAAGDVDEEGVPSIVCAGDVWARRPHAPLTSAATTAARTTTEFKPLLCTTHPLHAAQALTDGRSRDGARGAPSEIRA